MKVKKFLIIFVLLLMVLAACKPAAPEATEAPVVPSEPEETEEPVVVEEPEEPVVVEEPEVEPVELRFTYYADGIEAEVMQPLLDKFMTENPDITVVLDVVPSS